MKSRTIIVLLSLISLAGFAIIPAGDSEAVSSETHAVLWLYGEDGTLVTTLTVTEGKDLRHALNGVMATTPHWRDILTGYEYPMDKLVTHDLMLRASTEIPPQEPVPEPENHDLFYLGIAAVVIIAAMVGINAWWNRRP